MLIRQEQDRVMTSVISLDRNIWYFHPFLTILSICIHFKDTNLMKRIKKQQKTYFFSKYELQCIGTAYDGISRTGLLIIADDNVHNR